MAMLNLKLIIGFLSFCNLFVLCSTGNILFLYAHDERSHIYSMTAFLEKLLASNHTITLLETGANLKPLDFGPRVNTIYCPSRADGAFDELSAMMWRERFHSYIMPIPFIASDEALVHGVVDCGPQLSEILGDDYDLVVVDELFNIHGYVITHIIQKLKNVPFILYSTGHINPDNTLTATAMGYSPAVVSHHGTLPPESTSVFFSADQFYHRLINTLETASELLGFQYTFRNLQSPQLLKLHDFDAWKFLQSSGIHIGEFLDRHRVYPLATDFKSVGSYCRPVPELPEEFRRFIEDPKSKGTIYFAFGSLVNFDHCPDAIYHAFFDAIDAFPDYRVIFAAKSGYNRMNRTLPSHVKLVKWAPQSAILDHEKTKVFVTHGGLKSFKEALCSTTPIVVFPVFAEQHISAFVAIEHGIGRTLNKFGLTSESVITEINQVLNNNSYAENAIREKSIFLDRIVDSMDEAGFYAERLMRLAKEDPSKEHFLTFKRKGMTLTWSEFYQLDWILGVLSIVWFVSSS